jgi:centrosomal CEP192-like protein/HYDIN/CFA65/VesB family protein
MCSFIFGGCASVTAGNSAAGPAAAVVSIIPAEINFRSVVVGQKNSQTLQITNTSTKNLDLSTLHISGANFSLQSAKAPIVLAPGKILNMNVVFAPANEAEENGAITIASPELRAPIRIPLVGSGEKPVRALQVSPSIINFGTHTVNSSAFQTVTLTNTGNISLTVNSVTISGAGYAITGLSPGVSLSPQQRLEFQVWFHPFFTGNFAATLTANVPSLSSPLKLVVSGSATSTSVTSPSSTSTHSVTLDWNPSGSPVAGYHIYRGGQSGGPYSRLSSAVISTLNYVDSSVLSGGRYFYVVTALGTDGLESPFSNEVSAEIPNP